MTELCTIDNIRCAHWVKGRRDLCTHPVSKNIPAEYVSSPQGMCGPDLVLYSTAKEDDQDGY